MSAMEPCGQSCAVVWGGLVLALVLASGVWGTCVYGAARRCMKQTPLCQLVREACIQPSCAAQLWHCGTLMR